MPDLRVALLLEQVVGLGVHLLRLPVVHLDADPAYQPVLYARLMTSGGDVFVSIENNLFAVDPLLSYVTKEVEGVDPDFWRPKAPASKPAAENKPKEKTGT